MPSAIKQPQAPASKAATSRASKIGPMILIGCLVLAILTVLFIPMAVSGTATSSSHAASATAKAANAVAYGSPEEAIAALALQAAMPATWPEGLSAAGARVVDGNTLELDIVYGGNTLLYRVATGKADLSGIDYETIAYTATEDIARLSIGYAGPSEKKLNAAVWVNGDYSYALVAETGMDSEVLKALAAVLV